MAIELIELSGNVLMVIVSDKLSQPELAEAQRECAKIIASKGRLRIIVMTEDFQGWESGGDWGDLSFQQEADPQIERMALVGDKKWKDLALAFVGQGFRDFQIEYFERGELAKARSWIMSK